jgi:acetyl-CoA carboxylase biotin carboxylase subunit
LRAGWRIPPHYDSLVGKLIVHAPDRRVRSGGARGALRRCASRDQDDEPAPPRILDDPDFVAARTTCSFLERKALRGGVPVAKLTLDPIGSPRERALDEAT